MEKQGSSTHQETKQYWHKEEKDRDMSEENLWKERMKNKKKNMYMNMEQKIINI